MTEKMTTVTRSDNSTVKVETRLTLCVDGKVHILDTQDKSFPKGSGLPTIWIVRIFHRSGAELKACRVAGHQDVAEKAAEDWLNDMCMMNPGEAYYYSMSRVLTDWTNEE